VNVCLLGSRFEFKCQEVPSPVRAEAYNQLAMIMSSSPKKLVKKAMDICREHIEYVISTKLQR